MLLAQDDPARHVVRHESQTLSKDPMPLIECAFTAHPSMLNVPKDIDAVKLPLSVAVGETDMALSAAKVKIVKVCRNFLSLGQTNLLHRKLLKSRSGVTTK